METETWGRAIAYVGCALGIAVSSTTPGLAMSIYWCISLLVTYP